MKNVAGNFEVFSETLFQIMKSVNPGIEFLELYEFRYSLKNLNPDCGWQNLTLKDQETIEKTVRTLSFYENIQLKPSNGCKILLDRNITELTQMLFAGMAVGKYRPEWVGRHFYFDIRGFVFIPDTLYFTDKVISHFGGSPVMEFKKKQAAFETFQGVGYRDFRTANLELDTNLAKAIGRIIESSHLPVTIGIAGPTAAGKTEFTENLNTIFSAQGRSVTSVEMDNFFLDRDYREETGAGSMGIESVHYRLLLEALEKLKQGRETDIPRYDFVEAVSSHDNNGHLRNGAIPIRLEPADIVYVEGNFPFLFDEIVPLIDIKIVYITSDHVRLKRKWKRDIDYRKKYDPCYFINRYFRTQYPKAVECYIPQLEKADISADTTNARIWAVESFKQYF